MVNNVSADEGPPRLLTLFVVLMVLWVACSVSRAEPIPVATSDVTPSFVSTLVEKKRAVQEILLILRAMSRQTIEIERDTLSSFYLKKELARELETLLADINTLGQDAPTTNSQQSLTPKNPETETVENLVATLKRDAAPDLDSRGAQFSWPLKGDILSTPGKAFRHGGAKWPGLLIKANPGAEVRAISSGVVVYAGEMKHLGRLVILDHEDGYLSLYGRNARIFVQQNERVSVNQVLASVDNTSPKEQNGLYFEIRRHGSPVDPRLVCSNQRLPH
ncbi:MAG: murein hydrolase activator EnvC family protein [Gammaproteobacteria bacterium]